MDAAAQETRPLGRQAPFVLYWLTRTSSALAYQMIAVAVGWQIYALTHSKLALGMIGLAQFLPQLLLTLVAGAVADRFDRRVVSRICQAVAGCTAAFLAVGSFGLFGIHLHPAAIFVAVGVIGGARAFESPAMSALLARLVAPTQFQRAAAAAAAAFQSAMIVGPALGGLLYAFGATVPYATSATLYLLASTFAAFIVQRQQPAAAEREPVSRSSIFAGIAFIRSRPAILGAISLDLFAVLLGGATALLPVYASDILKTGPWGLGLLRSAPAIGALCTSAVLARWPLQRRVGLKMFAAVVVFGLGTLVFAISTWLPLSLVALLVMGSSDMVSVVIRMSLVQLSTPDEMRGRVSAVNSIFIGASNQLGEFESGATAALFGPEGAVVLGGVGTLLVVGLWMRWFPELRRRKALSGA